MNALRHMKLRTKLFGCFLIVTLSTLVVGVYGSLKIHEINDANTFMYEKITVPLSDLGDVAASVQRLRTIFAILVATEGVGEQEKTIGRIDVMRKKIVDRLASFEKGIITNEDRRMYGELIEARKKFVSVTDQVMALVRAAKLGEAEDLLHRGEGRKVSIEYQEEMDRAMEYMVSKAKHTSDANDELSNQATMWMYFIIALAVVVSVGLGVLLTSSVIGQLGEDPDYLSEVASNLAAGNLDGPFRDYKTDGSVYALILGVVGAMRKQLAFSQGVMQGVAVPFSVFSAEDKLLFTNQQMMDVLELQGNPDSQLGKTSSEYFYGIKGKETLSSRALREQRALEEDKTGQTRNGKALHVRISSSPFHDDKEQVLGTVAIWLNQTESVEARQAAENAANGMKQAANQLEKVVEVVSSASEELSAQIEQSSHGTEVQSQRVAETATAMDEMNATVIEVAKNASQAADSAGSARSMAVDGAKVVAEAVESITDVQQKSIILKTDMAALGKQAEGIGQIMNVISDIADQTNLLALNAAIEAARAGDAGRGFAVVADEVRKLAEKTMAATKEVGEAIGSIQQGARKNLENVEHSVVTIELATNLANQSGAALKEIVAMVEAATDQVRSIAAASEQQSAASDEITKSIEEINIISGETASAMTQSAQAVGDLASQAQTLRTLIEKMKSSA
ncbi:methyl-accepting chemotaxis protein [Nitratidesulfovibrio sp. SRB-5]|uniref:methyl-accepting chemotaxis protein n=1 Tax=Nitratidesulfovibrio sp. SRB-5 TaxID=2872636 RepID=UPI001027B0BE|nr:methyl-accepting chemotaxis protein [Nitratidesulfovibrio sp. SRB-5]MBZ2173012.1 MCP four helix bundle domain-containing protein [Nitratidesulfovibrio sp. SRB-5]RXF78457.1 methyl-accepting chemotaxis protein [Desulfovibrio sp. DS-1]